MGSQHLHIGSLIEEKLKEQERSVSWLAKRLSCDRTTVYRLLQKHSIDTHLLERISKELRFNFFSVLSDSLNDKLQ